MSSLERFSVCSHTGNNQESSQVCGYCAAILSNVSRQAEEDIAAAARFSASIAILAFRKKFGLLKKVAQHAAEVLRYSAETRERYLQKYYSLASSEAMKYTNDYRTGSLPVTEED